MADPALITAEQLTKRIGVAIINRIFDDLDVGTADSDVVEQFVEDASSKVRGALGPIYDVAIMDATTAIELRRIALDCAHAMAAQRHPGALKLDGFAMMDQVNADLKLIRTGLANLGTKNPPEPAANVGGDADSGDPDFPDPKPKFFLDGTGDF